jgi:hypothetical protein
MAEQATGEASSTRFLSSHNPALVKRNVLASFTSVLLMPVTIVPRAVGGALMTGGNAAVQGIAMLNPQRWGGGNSGSVGNGYSRNLELEKGVSLFDGDDDEDEKPAPSLCTFSSPRNVGYLMTTRSIRIVFRYPPRLAFCAFIVTQHHVHRNVHRDSSHR